MNVEELMSKEVRFCMPDHSLACAAQVMWESDCGCVPVVDPAGRVSGIITDRDVCMASYLNARAPQDLKVRDFMSHGVLACRAEDEVADAASMMRRAQVRRLPVTDADGRLMGILSLNDIAASAHEAEEDGPPELTTDEVGRTLCAVSQHRSPGMPLPA
jgi:CBS domain-containing protein